MQIKKNEIWLIDFDPTIWNEIKKTRPAIVISNSYYNISSWTIFVIPISSKGQKSIISPFHIELLTDSKTNLKIESYANISQMRAVSKLRFIKKTWNIEKGTFDLVIKKLLSIVEYDVLWTKYLN